MPDEIDQYNRDVFLDMRKSSYQAQVEYGKWIMASLLLIHGGSIFAIAQLGKDGMELFAASGPYFVAGIVAALLGGMFTWFNFSYAIEAYHSASQAIALKNDPYEALDPHRRKIHWTRLLAMGFGMLSAAIFVAGACRIFILLHALGERAGQLP